MTFERRSPLTQAANASQRASVDLAVWRSPGDVASSENPNDAANVFNNQLLNPRMSNYEDIGTSYYYNSIWFLHKRRTQFPQSLAGWAAAENEGLRQLNLATIDASRFVKFSDKNWARIYNDPQFRDWEGEFGGRNGVGMAFLDGHAGYINAERRSDTAGGSDIANRAAGNLVSSPTVKPYAYSFILPRLR